MLFVQVAGQTIPLMRLGIQSFIELFLPRRYALLNNKSHTAILVAVVEQSEAKNDGNNKVINAILTSKEV